jgi:hypothetical protein
MSETTPTPVPQPPTKKSRRWPWILVAVVALFAAVGLGAALGGGGTTETPSTSTSQESTADPVEEEVEPEPAPEPEYYEPTKRDFELTVKTLGKECFGSAGCNIEFRIEVTQDFTQQLDPLKTYEVTYEVRGTEDSPYINTLEVTGDEYYTDEYELAGTTTSGAKLTAVVTDVTEY